MWSPTKLLGPVDQQQPLAEMYSKEQKHGLILISPLGKHSDSLHHTIIFLPQVPEEFFLAKHEQYYRTHSIRARYTVHTQIIKLIQL